MAIARDPQRDWHRLFGLLLIDFFSDSPFRVEVEPDLSQQQQFLDVLIVRRAPGPLQVRLPDGLEGLLAHNLLTFKSHRETLTPWAMKELGCHYVSYRKLVSVSPSNPLPEEQFRLYAVCARFPHNLAQLVPWQQRQPGVYDCTWGTDVVRVIVAGELPREPHNAPLHLFSATPELLRFGQDTYRQRSPTTSALLAQLLERVHREGLLMPYTMEDFQRDYILEHFPRLTAEEQRKALQSLPAEQRQQLLQSLPVEERQQLLQSLPAEERLAGLSVEQIRHYLEQLTTEPPSTPRPRRRKK